MFAALILAVAATAGTAIALTATAQSATTTLGQRVLHTGDSGADVKKLQRLLVAVGAKTTTDGEFGSGTVSAVKRFQRWAGLQASGSVGTRTVQALTTAVKGKRTIGGSSAGGASMNMDGSDLSNEGDIPFAKASLSGNGTAIAPANAPSEVKEIIAAGNEIAKKPYVYGGGHGSWKSSGYDCSGSVSYALHGAGLLNTQLTSGDLEDWGNAGKGKWVTIYANGGHTFMYVAGLRFDTSGASPSRWQDEWRSKSGFVVRHPSGL